MFNEWEAKGSIKKKIGLNIIITPYEDIYDHPTLSHDILNKYYRKLFVFLFLAFSPAEKIGRWY